MNLVATSFANQPVCNAAWAAHALRSDQLQSVSYLLLNRSATSFKLGVKSRAEQMWMLVFSKIANIYICTKEEKAQVLYELSSWFNYKLNMNKQEKTFKKNGYIWIFARLGGGGSQVIPTD